MVFLAVYPGLLIRAFIGLRSEDVHQDSITIDERYCRGDWENRRATAAMPPSELIPCVIERIHRLKSLTVTVMAGRAKTAIQGRQVGLSNRSRISIGQGWKAHARITTSWPGSSSLLCINFLCDLAD
jgi:hypothetical protein